MRIAERPGDVFDALLHELEASWHITRETPSRARALGGEITEWRRRFETAVKIQGDPDGMWRTEELPNGIRRCDQCGRTGRRGFITVPKDPDGVESLTLCKRRSACARRWPE